MKTTEMMMQSLNERKRNYDEKRKIQKRRLSVIAAFAAAVILISVVTVGTALIANRAEKPIDTAVAGTSPQTVFDTFAQTGPETERNIDISVIPDNDSYSDGKPGDGRCRAYLSYEYFKHDKDIILVPTKLNSPAFPYRIGVKAEETVTFEVVFIGDVNQCKNLYISIETDDNIELISENSFAIDNSDNVITPKALITFKYKSDSLTGYFKINVDQDVSDGVSSESIHEWHKQLFFAARIKGYDFISNFGFISNNANCDNESGNTEEAINTFLPSLYADVASYFDDVDKHTGEPLFMLDPYNEDYYFNPVCNTLRVLKEAKAADQNLLQAGIPGENSIFIGGNISYGGELTGLSDAGLYAIVSGRVQGGVRTYFNAALTDENGDFFIILDCPNELIYETLNISVYAQPFSLCGIDVTAKAFHFSFGEIKDIKGGTVINTGNYDRTTGTPSEITVTMHEKGNATDKLALLRKSI